MRKRNTHDSPVHLSRPRSRCRHHKARSVGCICRCRSGSPPASRSGALQDKTARGRSARTNKQANKLQIREEKVPRHFKASLLAFSPKIRSRVCGSALTSSFFDTLGYCLVPHEYLQAAQDHFILSCPIIVIFKTIPT